MNALEILKQAGEWGPVFFGVAFLAPLIAQSMDALQVSGPGSLSTLQVGLGIGLAMGLVAKWRGSWV